MPVLIWYTSIGFVFRVQFIPSFLMKHLLNTWKSHWNFILGSAHSLTWEHALQDQNKIKGFKGILISIFHVFNLPYPA